MIKKLVSLLIILVFNLNLLAQDENYEYTFEDIQDDYIEALDNGEDRIEAFRLAFLKAIKADVNIKMLSEKMINLLNENMGDLIFEADISKKVRDKATLFKFAIELRDDKFVSEILYPLACKGINGKNLNINHYEIIDGEKETLLDYIEKILNTKTSVGLYDFNSLKKIKMDIIACGAKRGKEL